MGRNASFFLSPKGYSDFFLLRVDVFLAPWIDLGADELFLPFFQGVVKEPVLHSLSLFGGDNVLLHIRVRVASHS